MLRLPACLLFVLLLAWPAAARSEGTEVRLKNGAVNLAQGPWSGSTMSLRVAASSSKETHLTFIFTDELWDRELQTKTYELKIPAGSLQRRTLWVSSPAHDGHFKLRVEESGRKVHEAYLGKGSNYGMPLKGMAIASTPNLARVKRLAGTLSNIQSAETQEERWTREQQERSARPGPTPPAKVPRRLDGRQNSLDLETLLPPEAPESLRGYGGYDMVILDDPVDNALSASQAEALVQYTLSGGSLVWIRGESSSGSRQMAALSEALGLGRSPAGSLRAGRGWVFVASPAIFSEASDATLRDGLLATLIDQRAYIKGVDRNDYRWYRDDPEDVFRGKVQVLADGLFEPPGWMSVLVLFILIVVTVGPLNRLILKRRGLTALYPLTVAAVSVAWLGVIYAVGVSQHGLGTTTRRFVVWDQWKGDLGLQTESLCLFTSFGTSLDLKALSPTLIHSLTESFIELVDDGDLRLDGAPLHIWSPAVFEASAPLRLGGRLRFEEGTFINETPQDFEFAVAQRDGSLHMARNLPAGGRASAKAMAGNFDNLEPADCGIPDEKGAVAHHFIQLCRGERETRGRSGIMAFGRQAPTLLAEGPKADEVYAVYFGGLDE